MPAHLFNLHNNARGEVTGGTHPKPGRNFAYGYDAIGNREGPAYTANALNQVAQRTVPGVLEVRGSVAGGVNGLGALIDGQPAPLSGRDFYRALSVDNSAAAVWKSVDIWAWGDNDGQEVETHETRRGLVPKTPEVFEHDADGNLTKDGQWCYQWDAENRLVRMYRYMPQGWTTLPDFKVWELTFHYDWQGRRVLKRVNPGGWETNQRSVQFAYDGWNVVAERETFSVEGGWNTTLRRYVWGADLSGSLQGAGGVGGLLAETFTDDYGEHTLLPAYDGNGNIVAMLDGTGGAVRAEYSYGPFGEPLRATGAMARSNPFRWSTKYCDEETGLCYYGYRYYSATAGRWLSRDPIEERGGTNLFAFCYNSPTEWIDDVGNAPKRNGGPVPLGNQPWINGNPPPGGQVQPPAPKPPLPKPEVPGSPPGNGISAIVDAFEKVTDMAVNRLRDELIKDGLKECARQATKAPKANCLWCCEIGLYKILILTTSSHTWRYGGAALHGTSCAEVKKPPQQQGQQVTPNPFPNWPADAKYIPATNPPEYESRSIGRFSPEPFYQDF